MAASQIQTGPQAHERDDHFAAGDRPADDRFGILALTLWTGHITPPVLDRTNAEVRAVCLMWLSRVRLKRKEDAKESTHRRECQVFYMFQAVEVLRGLAFEVTRGF